jgi:HlyD family secretion protein
MDRPLVLPWWRRPAWLKRGISVGALALCVIVVGVLSRTAERKVRIASTSLTVATVVRGAYHDFVPVQAKVVALNAVYLDALEGGRVERVLAQAGDMVTQGQMLVELSNTELELDVLDREGRLIESITQLQSYQTQLEQNRSANEKALAQIDYEITRLRRSLARRKVLAAQSLEPVSVKESVEDELNYEEELQPIQQESNRKQEELRVRQTPQIQSQLEKLQEDLRITHGKLDNLVVRAPIAGRLTSLDLRVGENRNRGERLGEITPETGFKLSATLDEYYLGRVQAGQVAVFDVDEKAVSAKVSRVYPQVTDNTFTIDLAFDGNSPPNLLPGQSLQGKLALGADESAILLPAGAFLDKTGGTWVFVLDPDGRTAHRRAIKIGRHNAEQVEVLQSLRPGERVIVSDYSGFDGIDRIDIER